MAASGSPGCSPRSWVASAGRAPLHLEPAGQHALGAAAVVDALLHHLPQVQQALAHLGLGAPRQLVGHHDAADRQAGLRAAREQLVAGGERVRHRGVVGHDHVLADLVLVEHEPAAHRVVLALVQRLLALVRRRRGPGREAHAVGVEGQRSCGGAARRRCRGRRRSRGCRRAAAGRWRAPPPGAGRRARGSVVSGASPSRPSTTALTEPCPWPVAPSEPNSSARTRPTCSSRPAVRSPRAKVCAARIGPTVCELEGPMPTEKRSNALMAIAAQCVRSRARRT